MTRDFSKIKSFWGSKLQVIPKELLTGFHLNTNTFYYLTNIGLPNDTGFLKEALEINFYFDSNKIARREFKGISYCVIGDDSGTRLSISLTDNHLYAIDFDNLHGIDAVCFVSSTIDKFVEAIQLFIEFQRLHLEMEMPERESIELLKVKMKDIDPASVGHDRTWWSMVLNDPLMD
jgi:hypothetical protein